MATSIWFNGKEILQPGVYTDIISGIKNPIQQLDYSRLLLIDTGYGSEFGSGAGVAGEYTKGAKSIQMFDNALDFQRVVMGGPFYAAAPFLFSPKGFTIPGATVLYYIRACGTTPASINFEDGATSLILKAKNEGLVGNGKLDDLTGVNLESGFSFKMRPGRATLTYHLDFYRGNYKGKDTDGIPWNGAVAEKTRESLLFSSAAFKNSEELVNWMATNSDFKDWFLFDTALSVFNTDPTTPGLYSTHALFGDTTKGGVLATESYGTPHLESVLEAVTDLDYSFILSDVYGLHAYQSDEHELILKHLAQEAKFDKYLIVGGGQDENQFDNGARKPLPTPTGDEGSIQIAISLDTSLATVVHGGFYKSLRLSTLTSSSVVLKEYNSFFKAANVIGRILGKPPQVPGTFKTLDYDAEVHVLKSYEIDDGLKKGVLMTRWDSEANDFIIVQAINTLQDNDFLVNEDGQSFEISIERIKQALNKGIQINAKKQLLLKEDGVNRGTLSAQDMKLWIQNYLQQQTVTPTEDNLIITYQNVTVKINAIDTYSCSYEFVPNWPVNKLIIIGIIIDI
jgi:hypothetical protein